MFGGLLKFKSDNVNNVSVNFNYLLLGDALLNGIFDINEISWSIVYIRDYYKKIFGIRLFVIYVFGIILFFIRVMIEYCISKCCLS